MRVDEPVDAWRPEGAGAWIGGLVPDLDLPFTVERLVQFWFEPLDRAPLVPEHCPISIWEHQPGRYFYAFPWLEHGFKAAVHHEGELTDVDRLRREVGSEEHRPLHDLLRRYLPPAAGSLLDSAVCMYTNTPDGHFVLDFHPEHRQVLIVSACSGHGFKFAAAIGEIVASLAIEGASSFDLGMFRLGRLRTARE